MDKINGFSSDLSSDEEIEQCLDDILGFVNEKISEEEAKNAINDMEKVRQVLYVYQLMKRLTIGINGVEVNYRLNEPFRSMGSVSVTGASIVFFSSKYFMQAIDMASNFEVYPKTDGTVQMNFTFHGLTIPLE